MQPGSQFVRHVFTSWEPRSRAPRFFATLSSCVYLARQGDATHWGLDYSVYLLLYDCYYHYLLIVLNSDFQYFFSLCTKEIIVPEDSYKRGFLIVLYIFTFKSGKTDSHKRVEVGIRVVHKASLNLADMVKWFGIWDWQHIR